MVEGEISRDDIRRFWEKVPEESHRTISGSETDPAADTFVLEVEKELRQQDKKLSERDAAAIKVLVNGVIAEFKSPTDSVKGANEMEKAVNNLGIRLGQIGVEVAAFVPWQLWFKACAEKKAATQSGHAAMAYLDAKKPDTQAP